MSTILPCFTSTPLPLRPVRSFIKVDESFHCTSPPLRVSRCRTSVKSSYDVNLGNKQGSKLASAKSLTLKRLRQKLVTFEDREWVHKIAGLVHLSTSAILIANLFYSTIAAGGFPDIPTSPWFDFLLVSWVASTITQGINGATLAVRFRSLRQESAVFVGTGLSSALSAWIAWFSTPHFPNFLHHGPVTPLIVSTLSFAGIGFTALACIDAPFLTKRRLRHSKESRSLAQEALANVAYVGPIAVGAPLFIGAYRMLVLHGHDGFMEYVASMPHLDSFSMYNNILWAVAATTGALVVTLRDKKVISPTSERGIIVILAVVALVYYLGGLFSFPEWWRLWQL